MGEIDLFGKSEEKHDMQVDLSMDDHSGLRVVDAKFLNKHQFAKELFKGYDYLRALTYSASVCAMDKYSFANFECVFGYEEVLCDINDVLSFQKMVIGNTRAAIMGLKDDRNIHIGKTALRQCSFLTAQSMI